MLLSNPFNFYAFCTKRRDNFVSIRLVSCVALDVASRRTGKLWRRLCLFEVQDYDLWGTILFVVHHSDNTYLPKVLCHVSFSYDVTVISTSSIRHRNPKRLLPLDIYQLSTQTFNLQVFPQVTRSLPTFSLRMLRLSSKPFHFNPRQMAAGERVTLVPVSAVRDDGRVDV